MRRRWFLLGSAVIFLLGLWVLGARPSELMPNEGGRAAAADFFGGALQPAVDYEEVEMRGKGVPFLEKVGRALWLTVRYALAALSLALVMGVVGGILGSRAWWTKSNLMLETMRIGVRLVATALRSVHELMWALLFLSALGTSPLTAVLALALPYGGTLAKVFSELLDEVESSAAEVVRASGGTGMAAFFTAVVPQALPDLATYGLYRLECAVRSSAVLGFVGVPTLGYELKTAFEDGHFREIWTYLYALLVVVVFFEWAGGKVRERLARGVPAKDQRAGATVAELWKGRGRSAFLRGFVVVYLLATGVSWYVEEQWSAGVSWEQRMRNLDRFTNEIVPFPVREAGNDWGEFGPWFWGMMNERGYEAMWQTLHLGTAAILLAGVISMLAIRYAARTLASRHPRQVHEGRGWLGELVGGLWRGVAMLSRAIPEFILAFLLLRILGPSIWVLILALAIHNGGILLRLGAEVVDHTRSQAGSVILAQGGSRSAAYWGALIPASFNRFVLFLFYRWESCIREASVLGMVGVASLGFLISDAKVAFFYDEMVLWVALGASLVFAGDLISDWLRSRLRQAA